MLDSYIPFIPVSYTHLEDRFFSVYANAAYTYDNRYSVTVSFRTDASNFQAESVRDKFAPFWSFGASWLISNEQFMEQETWVDQLKLRVSYGLAGIAAGKSGTSSVTTVEAVSYTHLSLIVYNYMVSIWRIPCLY